MKINEKSQFTLDLKTIILIVGGIISLSATYFTLQAGIEEAKTPDNFKQRNAIRESARTIK